MAELDFAFTVATPGAEREAMILANSIRTFAGRFAGSAIWALLPESTMQIEAESRDRLTGLGVRLVPYHIDKSLLAFPFGGKVVAAAAAESMASGESSFLVWMDVDSIVFNEPESLMFDQGRHLGYRPVDHTLIGSPFDEPADHFWAHVYRRFQVSEKDMFPMETSVDRRIIRPYFNAGMVVIRPERGVLQSWCDGFLDLIGDPFFDDLYEENVLYKIFLHQAALAGAILSSLKKAELQELPSSVNYPLHMHRQYPPHARPSFLDELITGRYDVLFQDPQWRTHLPFREPFRSWLEDQLMSMSKPGTNDG